MSRESTRFSLERVLSLHSWRTHKKIDIKETERICRRCQMLFGISFLASLNLFSFFLSSLFLLLDEEEGVELNRKRRRIHSRRSSVTMGIWPVPREWTDRQFRSKQPTPAVEIIFSDFFFMEERKKRKKTYSFAFISYFLWKLSGCFLSLFWESFPEIGITSRARERSIQRGSHPLALLWFHAVIDRFFSPLRNFLAPRFEIVIWQPAWPSLFCSLIHPAHTDCAVAPSPPMESELLVIIIIPFFFFIDS